MPIGTLPEEQRYTAAEVEEEDSSTGKFFYIWHTLGFGGENLPTGLRASSFVRFTNGPGGDGSGMDTLAIVCC